MKTLLRILTRQKSIYTPRIFETRSWLNQAVTEAMRIQEMDLNLTTNPNISEQ